MSGWPGFDDLMARLRDYYVTDPEARRGRFRRAAVAPAAVHHVRPRARAGPGRRARSPAQDCARDPGPQRNVAGRRPPPPGRAAATLERAETGMRELGQGKDFLVVYYGSDRAGGWQRLDRPLRTLTTLDRFGLVQWREGRPTLRMLQVPEIKRAMGLQGFPLNHGTRRDKVKLLGNGVCAPVMEEVVRSLTSKGRCGTLPDGGSNIIGTTLVRSNASHASSDSPSSPLEDLCREIVPHHRAGQHAPLPKSLCRGIITPSWKTALEELAPRPCSCRLDWTRLGDRNRA